MNEWMSDFTHTLMVFKGEAMREFNDFPKIANTISSQAEYSVVHKQLFTQKILNASVALEVIAAVDAVMKATAFKQPQQLGWTIQKTLLLIIRDHSDGGKSAIDTLKDAAYISSANRILNALLNLMNP